MESVKVSGGTLAYETAGAGEPVLLIHGALIADSFRPLFSYQSLLDNYQLVSYHRRGYGQSSGLSESISIGRQVADCHELVRHLGLRRIHVVGHSYGGVIALQLALDAPNLVETLSLLEPALILGDSGGDYRNSLARGIERFEEVGAEQVVDEFFTMRFGPNFKEPLERVIPGAIKQAETDSGTAFAFDLPALFEWDFGESEIQRITQPVLSVIGSDSVTLSPRFAETHEQLLTLLKCVDGYVLPNAAHGLQMQNGPDMARALQRFWEGHRAC